MVENGQIWLWNGNKLFIFMIHHHSKNSCKKFPLFRWGSYKRLAPQHKHLGSGIRTRYCHITTHGYTIDSDRSLKIQINDESFWVQCPTFTTHLPKPHVSPQIIKQGESGVFPDCKDMVSTPITSNSRYPVGTPLSIDFWYHICGVSANATGWDIKTLLTSQGYLQPGGSHTSDQVIKSGCFHDPPPYSITQSNQGLNSGKPVLTLIRLIYRRKLRNSEMEETWRAKKEWRCGECSCPREKNTLTSSTLVPTHELSECQNLWSFIFMFLIFIEVSIIRDIDYIIGQQWLISVPSLLTTSEEGSNPFFFFMFSSIFFFL